MVTGIIFHFREAQDQPVEASSAYWSCEGGTCGPCASSVLTLKESENLTYGGMLQEIIDLGEDFGSTLATRRLTKLSCHSTEQVDYQTQISPSTFPCSIINNIDVV